ncbi:MAG: S1/P1 nuclease [Zoogloeaceae bacterium]|jgi:hypothetical protein|nr:S1/P1 nuclease [Zoogloeaceae bacterium]
MKRWILLFITFLPITVWAWNATGHRQVAALAWEVMDIPVRRQVTLLLRQHPDYARWQKRQQEKDPDYGVFLEASTWADDIRGDRRFYSPNEYPTPLLPGFPDMARHGNWHYQDAQGGELARRLPELAQTLTEKGSGQDERAGEQAYALVWLLHLVGDLHQPLHTGGRSDRGGNQLKVRLNQNVPGFKAGKQISLHRYWDNLPGPPWLRGERLRASIATLERIPDEKGRTGDVESWLAESQVLARRGAYPTVKGGTGRISPAFHQKAKGIAEERIALAGYRLGVWLNQLFGAASSTY